MQQRRNKATSWEPVQKWYKSSVGDSGHYYHQQIIIPGVLRLLNLSKNPSQQSILDIACGQGVLARQLPENIPYTGIDASPTLIKEAKNKDSNPLHRYLISDVTKKFPLKKGELFSHASIILALQNLEYPDQTIKNCAPFLQENGKLIIVLNHPCFRIPRQSSWAIDQEKKIQYRRMDAYASPMSIPIKAHPSKGTHSPSTWSFHFSLGLISKWLFEAGFEIQLMEEWYSDKISTGSAAKMENRCRLEFPLFLTIVARKNGPLDNKELYGNC